MRIKNACDVGLWRLCLGCGACAYVCPEKKIQLIDVVNDGIRIRLDSNDCGDCSECLKVCPGYHTEHQSFTANNTLTRALSQSFGPILEMWEGHATDSEIRFNGSSGGASTAIALYCLEKEGMYGALHIGADAESPWMNKTVFSKKREELLLRTGSRYSPASPCNGLDRIEGAPSSCVFIGKPCDIAGLRKAQSLKPKLNEKVGAAIGIFCAGTPSTQGTLDLMNLLKVDSKEVTEIRYRGKGWPGSTRILTKRQDVHSCHMSYSQSWGYLQKYRPHRCFLCPDGTGEFADVSCGDPWYREIKEGEAGYSLILARSERGRKIVHGALETGYVSLKRVDPKVLVESQKNLLSKRKAIWGRLIAMKICGIPTPKLRGFSLFKNWRSLGSKEKLRSVLGTARRIIQRRYFFPMRLIR